MRKPLKVPGLGLISSIRLSVRRKLMVVVLVTTVLALLLMGISMLVYDLRTYRDAWISDLSTQADLIAHASAPALAFDDEKVASENLALLADLPKVYAAALYTADGRRFASYARADRGAADFPARPSPDGYRIEGREVVLFKHVESNGEMVGTLYLRASYQLVERLASYLVILVVALAVSLVVALLMTSWLQRSVTGPILDMADVARRVMARRDFSLRAGKTTDDEVGYLVDTFNAMLGEIGGRTEALEASNRTLEQEMAVRRNAEKALLAADRQKDQFLATLAHELRNPLAPLLNALQMLRLAGDDSRISSSMREMMERQLRQLVQLVDDLLDVSRITTGKMVLHTERCELASIVHSAVEAVTPLITSGRHRLSLELPPHPVWLMADPTRLAQVFINVLNNAAKFTNPGGSIAFLAVVRGCSVTITVSDNGMGITRDMLPQVFGMFTQADRSLDRAHAGLGVGLSLARQLVELHGGTIAADSAGPGRGSQFTITLPTLEAAAVQEAAPVTATSPVARKLRLLLADDNVDFAASLAMLLQSSGHEVAVAHDGLQALEVAAAFQPDMCLLDIGLPRLHGYDLARRLRELPATRDAVLVAISGWGQPEDKRRSREAGFDHHLSKPVEFDQILKLLADFVATREA
ncbi:MAG: ATP-binding protein [Burkholderiaceae bacterium]